MYSKRSKRAYRNIVAMFGLKGISVICSLLTVSLSIDFVSKYEYGIWITVSSLVAWLSFFDLGIGNGLRNKFIEAVERGKHRLARIYVSTSYALISLIVGGVWLTAIVASFFLDWCAILNAAPELSRQLLITVLIVITNFSVIFILGINRTLLTALQKPAIASAFDTLTQVLLCATLFILIHTADGSLVTLALAMGGTSLFVLVISNIWTYSTILRRYRPTLRMVRFRLARGVMTMGLQFFFIQIIAIAFYQTNNLIISHYVGPDEVTVYNVAYRYMQVLTMIFTIIITPFWSSFAEADINGDYEWMRRTVKRLLMVVGVIAMLGVVMTIVSPFFYRIWIQGKVEVPMLITVLVCSFHICNIWSTLWTQLLCGLGKIRLQTICSTLCCLAYLPTGIWGCRHFGLPGLLCASVGSMVVFTSWFGIIQVRKIINGRANGVWAR